MTQEKPRRENLLKGALYLSLHRKIKYTFSTEDFRLIFYRNFSIFVPHLCLKTVPPICCTELYGQFLIYVPAQKSVMYEMSYRPRKTCCFCPRKSCQPFSISLPQFVCQFLLYSCLDLRIVRSLNSGQHFQPALSICVQKISLGICANSQLKNLPSLLHQLRNSLTLFSLLLVSLPSPSTCF